MYRIDREKAGWVTGANAEALARSNDKAKIFVFTIFEFSWCLVVAA